MIPDRVLIVGFGSIGKRHLVVTREILPLADIRILRRQASAEVPEFSNGFLNTFEEVNSFKPQIAIISNPAPFHIGTAKILAKMGCHLLVEKPLAATTKGVLKFLKAVEKQKIKLQVGYNLRYLKSLQELKKLIENNIIGEVLSIRCEVGQYLPSWRPDTDYREGVTAQKKLGGGVLLELSHEIDYIRWIFGEIKWVSAWISKVSDLETDTEDIAHLLLGFATASSSHVAAILTMDFVRLDTTRQCTVIGSKGTLKWDGLQGTLLHHLNGKNETNVLSHSLEDRNETFKSQIKHFLNGISTSNEFTTSGYDGLQVLKIIEAARKSSKKAGKRIRV